MLVAAANGANDTSRGVATLAGCRAGRRGRQPRPADSTTHVTVGAIAGIAGSDTSRLNRRSLTHFGIAWTVTPAVAGSAAALAALLAR